MWQSAKYAAITYSRFSDMPSHSVFNNCVTNVTVTRAPTNGVNRFLSQKSEVKTFFIVLSKVVTTSPPPFPRRLSSVPRKFSPQQI